MALIHLTTTPKRAEVETVLRHLGRVVAQETRIFSKTGGSKIVDPMIGATLLSLMGENVPSTWHHHLHPLLKTLDATTRPKVETHLLLPGDVHVNSGFMVHMPKALGT